MNSVRRSFFGHLVGVVLGLLGTTAAKLPDNHRPSGKGASDEKGRPLRLVFRNDGNGWREIPWEQLRKGDKVLFMDLWDGHLSSLEACEVKGAPDLEKDLMPVEIGYRAEMLPKLWGNTTAGSFQLPDEDQISS